MENGETEVAYLYVTMWGKMVDKNEKWTKQLSRATCRALQFVELALHVSRLAHKVLNTPEFYFIFNFVPNWTLVFVFCFFCTSELLLHIY